MPQHDQLTGADLHEPKGVETANSGEVYVADGAGSGVWSDPLAEVVNLNTFDANGVIADVSTANSSYSIRVARDATLTNIYAAMDAAIKGSDSTVTLYRDGVALGQTFPIPVSGSGSGVKRTLNLSPSYAFTSGQILKLESDGASTDPSALYFTCKFTV
jgi:hypothetical protein